MTQASMPAPVVPGSTGRIAATAPTATPLDITGALIDRLQRWATGRLPRRCRGVMDTCDLVQETVRRSLRNLESFQPHHANALEAYMRTALLNRIRDEIRRAARQPACCAVDPSLPAGDQSPDAGIIDHENVEIYERAMKRLRAADRKALLARLDLGLSYDQAAGLLNKPTAGAARMAIHRALLRLAKEIHRQTGTPEIADPNSGTR